MKNVIKYRPKPTVYGTGLVALDIVISLNLDESAYQWAGGTCGNVLTILSYLGWNSYPIARLNEDSSSLRIKQDMKKWGVKLNYASLSPKASAPVITQEISIDKKGNPAHKFYWRNCPKCGSYLPSYSPVTLKGTTKVKKSVKKSNVYFFDRISPSALGLARYFKELGSVIFFEPSAKGSLNQFEEAVRLADVIKYSDQRFLSILDRKKDVNPFLEIQTLGDNGIRYRCTRRYTWKTISAFDSEDVKDACGCGDWTTAGIISKLFDSEHSNLEQFSIGEIEKALKYGQALGAWNCSFEGARGGMYRIKKETFVKEVNLILKEGKLKARERTKKPSAKHASDGFCPACPVVN